jgi:hypothetical protein
MSLSSTDDFVKKIIANEWEKIICPCRGSFGQNRKISGIIFKRRKKRRQRSILLVHLEINGREEKGYCSTSS